MALGIMGLPNVGKSTLFNALAGTAVACSNYPFCTVDANVGVVPVPDERLTRLGELLEPEKLTPTTVRFVDIAGLVRGASLGEGLGNRFLANIRDVDAVVHVVRCFEDASVSHVEGETNPSRDIDIIRTELLLADLETAERNLEKARKDAGRGDKEAGELADALERARDALDAGTRIADAGLSESDRGHLSVYRFLTDKDTLYVANIGEDDVGTASTWVERLAEATGEPDWKVVPLSARLEAELAALDAEDRSEFVAAWGLSEAGLPRLIRAGYRLLGLVTFFTIKGDEVRAWTVQGGATAVEAAGTIHTDMAHGFIRAEVVPFEKLIEAGSMHAARESGDVRTEGRDYVMTDGDVMLVRFN
ncbi:MAG: redox-regulated ATPase YchF [Candidatus Eisenbacteria bacterium]|nr:redox-regulated ATPase YchF [Candidatus Eisenbacteria bacterium]